MNQDAGGVLEKLGKGWVGPRWRGCALGSVGVRLCRGSRMVSVLLYSPCVEVENSSLVLDFLRTSLEKYRLLKMGIALKGIFQFFFFFYISYIILSVPINASLI
jgi:hypothetical protein